MAPAPDSSIWEDKNLNGEIQNLEASLGYVP